MCMENTVHLKTCMPQILKPSFDCVVDASFALFKYMSKLSHLRRGSESSDDNDDCRDNTKGIAKPALISSTCIKESSVQRAHWHLAM
jgi:hypothetical protein